MARILNGNGLVEVRRSSIQGKGVFALRRIDKGRRILEYTGERITSPEAESRYNDESTKRHHTFLFAVDDDWCVDATRVGNDAKYINHSCEPNCETVIERGRIFVEALTSISAGAELFYDYWYRTDATYTNDNLRLLYPCKCGTTGCRGSLAAPRPKPRTKTAKKAARTKTAKKAARTKTAKKAARTKTAKKAARTKTAKKAARTKTAKKAPPAKAARKGARAKADARGRGSRTATTSRRA